MLRDSRLVSRAFAALANPPTTRGELRRGYLFAARIPRRYSLLRRPVTFRLVRGKRGPLVGGREFTRTASKTGRDFWEYLGAKATLIIRSRSTPEFRHSSRVRPLASLVSVAGDGSYAPFAVIPKGRCEVSVGWIADLRQPRGEMARTRRIAALRPLPDFSCDDPHRTLSSRSVNQAYSPGQQGPSPEGVALYADSAYIRNLSTSHYERRRADFIGRITRTAGATPY